MNNLHYILIALLSLFIILSLVIEPKSFDEYFDFDIDTTIPEEVVHPNLQEEQKTTFDIEAFFSAIEDQETESAKPIESITGWTIEVEEYDDKEALMNDFKILKDRDFKVYIQYKNNEDNKFILYVGPTMDRDDSSKNLAKMSDLTKFDPKIVPYD